ncbi:MAG: FmdE family protein [Sulfurospirillaceae bacterium]|nr:FmdE family protein [Sulfurospirillaceae bacterium]
MNLWEKCVAFHGHSCPGLAIGFRTVEAAQKWLGLVGFSHDEELVCVSENDACGIDAVQVLLGCSTGKGNLIHKDMGKQAFSFFDRKNNKKGRIVYKHPFSPNIQREELQKNILSTPLEELFELKMPDFEVPIQAKIFKSIQCEKCGESAMEQKMRLEDGKKLCLDCASAYTRGWGRLL